MTAIFNPTPATAVTDRKSSKGDISLEKNKYYANRFFEFMKSIPEIKTAIRDTSSIDNMVYM